MWPTSEIYKLHGRAINEKLRAADICNAYKYLVFSIMNNFVFKNCKRIFGGTIFKFGTNI